jgi:hypothetical protein
VNETIAGATYRCRERVGRNTWHHEPVESRERECPDFLWTHASAEWRAASSGAPATEPIYRVEVVEAGRSSASP